MLRRQCGQSNPAEEKSSGAAALQETHHTQAGRTGDQHLLPGLHFVPPTPSRLDVSTILHPVLKQAEGDLKESNRLAKQGPHGGGPDASQERREFIEVLDRALDWPSPSTQRETVRISGWP